MTKIVEAGIIKAISVMPLMGFALSSFIIVVAKVIFFLMGGSFC
jgi:hypothetical protein